MKTFLLAELFQKTVSLASSSSKTIANIVSNAAVKLQAERLGTKALVEYADRTISTVITESKLLASYLSLNATKLQIEVGLFLQQIFRPVDEITNITDSVNIVFEKNVVSGTSLVDQTVKDFNKNIPQQLVIQENLTVNFSKILTDQINFTDALTTFSYTGDIKYQTDTGNISDDLSISYIKNPKDFAGISDSLSVTIQDYVDSFSYYLEDYVGNIVLRTLYKSIYDGINLQDNINLTIYQNLLKTSAEVAIITDSYVFEYGKGILQTLNTSDSVLVSIQNYTNSADYFIQDYVGNSFT